ncbi:MAG: hypothetical protein JWQ28_2964 [Pedobacter sp.]|jgi:hypothetical protein|nr:hypothetical protein [Pedobacter sp.]
MDFTHYQQYFQSILNAEHPSPPYNDPAYINYTKLNWSRQQRWIKVGELNEDLQVLITSIKIRQQWIVITEPWCGDAAHIVPFIYKLSQLNPLIHLDIQLRDKEPHLIEDYLSGQSKSIPKFIIRNEAGADLMVWGPRPAESQVLFDRLKEQGVDFEEFKTQLQQWYNLDKGKSLQEELLDQIKTIV